MKRPLACVVAILGLAALVAGIGAAADAPQVLPRPGVDVRPQDSRIVEPVPLPVSGTVQVVAAATLPVDVVGAEGAPLRVQVVNPPNCRPGRAGRTGALLPHRSRRRGGEPGAGARGGGAGILAPRPPREGRRARHACRLLDQRGAGAAHLRGGGL